MSTNLLDVRDLISQAEAARLRGTTRQAIARLVGKGRLKSWIVGGRTFVSRTEVQEFARKAAGRPPK